MKKLIYLLLFLSQIAFCNAGSNSMERFNRATILYNKGNFKQAAELYESILTDNKEVSVEIYYNLANSYYQLKQLAPAIYNYEKALLLDPDNDKVKTNLELAQKKTVDKIKSAKKSGIGNLFDAIINYFHYNTWAWIAVFLGFACTLFFSLYYFLASSNLKRLFFSLLLVSVLACCISMIFGFTQKYNAQSKRPAIVFAKATEGKQAPRSNSETTLTLHEGTKVFIQETAGNWYQVQLTDNTEVWVQKSEVMELR